MADFVEKEKCKGNWKGHDISFNREWSGHRFTDAECEALLAGKEIIIEAKSSKTGNLFSVCGKLGEGEYKGKSFIAFQPNFDKKIIPVSFLGHTFSAEERKKLENNDMIIISDFVSKAGKTFEAGVTFDTKEGLKLNFPEK